MHVKINNYYTATVRNIISFKRLLIDEKVDKSLLEIVSVNNNPPKEFVIAIENIIKNYKKSYRNNDNLNVRNYTIGGL